MDEPRRWRGRTIDWEVSRQGSWLVAVGYYWDRQVTRIKSRRSWVLAVRVAVSHAWWSMRTWRYR